MPVNYLTKAIRPLIERPFSIKFLEAQGLLAHNILVSKNPAVAFSGGKDSMIVLFMAVQLKPDILVVYNNTGVEYRLTNDFVQELRKLWNLNLVETHPKKTFWECAEQYGYMTSKTDKGRSHSGNCCYWLKEKPMHEAIKSLKIDALITGLTAVENRQRMLMSTKYGNCHYSKTWGCQRVHPIMWWTEDEVWQYTNDMELPINKMYKPPFSCKRVGCMPCTAYKGWETELSRTNPKLYRLLKLRKDSQYVMPLGGEDKV